MQLLVPVRALLPGGGEPAGLALDAKAGRAHLLAEDVGFRAEAEAGTPEGQRRRPHSALHMSVLRRGEVRAHRGVPDQLPQERDTHGRPRDHRPGNRNRGHKHTSE